MRTFQDECEAQPDPFIIYKYPQYLDLAREGMAKVSRFALLWKRITLSQAVA
jgi:hypothetical protein